MRIALVTPESNLVAGVPPLNLGYLAGYLRDNADVDVKIVDGNIGQNVHALLEKFSPELVGITASTPQINAAYNLADWIDDTLGSYVVMGGVHVTSLPREAIKHCDIVVRGEGEHALLNIVKKLEHDSYLPTKILEGIPLENIDDVFPAWDLMDIETYIARDDNVGNTLRHNPELKDYPIRCVPMITSRGCPYRCIFCWNSFRTAKTRFNSAEYIVDQLFELKNWYNVNTIWFTDDEFVVNKKRLKRLAKLFKEHGLQYDLIWGCQARATSLDLQTMKLMKSFGCRLIGVGFESGNERVLGLLKNKTVTVADNERALAYSQKTGLPVGGSFILGTPTETKEEMYETLSFIEKQDALAFVGIGALIPYPGTPVWKMCKLPEKVDYDRLVPTPLPEESYITCDTMSEREYTSTFRKIHAIAGVTQKIREIYRSHSFHLWELLKLFRFKRMWYFCFFHPIKLIKLLRRMQR